MFQRGSEGSRAKERNGPPTNRYDALQEEQMTADVDRGQRVSVKKGPAKEWRRKIEEERDRQEKKVIELKKKEKSDEVGEIKERSTVDFEATETVMAAYNTPATEVGQGEVTREEEVRVDSVNRDTNLVRIESEHGPEEVKSLMGEGLTQEGKVNKKAHRFQPKVKTLGFKKRNGSAGRTHQVVFGSISNNKPIKLDQVVEINGAGLFSVKNPSCKTSGSNFIKESE